MKKALFSQRTFNIFLALQVAIGLCQAAAATLPGGIVEVPRDHLIYYFTPAKGVSDKFTRSQYGLIRKTIEGDSESVLVNEQSHRRCFSNKEVSIQEWEIHVVGKSKNDYD